MTSGESTAPARPSRRTIATWIAIPLLALLAFVAWGMSSAVGSSPDDDFHLSSIWCGHGESELCEVSGDVDERLVMRDLVIDSVCFAFNADAGAGCQGEDFGHNPEETVSTPRGNFTGLYPPIYYLAMSVFAGEDIEASVLTMRIVNSVLFVGLVTALFALLPAHRRETLTGALALSLVPLGMFLVPSTNPSGWAILSAGTLWIALLGVFETTGRRRIALAGIALLATLIGAGARADGALYAGLAIVLVLLLTFGRKDGRIPRTWLLTALVALGLMVIAVVLYFSAKQGAAAATTGLGVTDAPPVDPLLLAMGNLINIPALWVGVFGSWNLGWLDTAMPASVWVAAFGCFAGTIFLGLAAKVPRKGIAVVIIVAALVFMPTTLLVLSQSLVGANYQPRYLMPLIVMLAGFVLLTRAGDRVATVPVQRWIIVVSLSLANAVALHTNLRRYLTGADVASLNLDAGAEWWWDLPISPMTVWIAGSLAFAGVLVGGQLLLSRRSTLPATARGPLERR